MQTLKPQQITPDLAEGHVRELPSETVNISDYDSPEFVLMDDNLSDGQKLQILNSWLPEKQGKVEINARGQEVDENAPYTRRVPLAIEAVKSGTA